MTYQEEGTGLAGQRLKGEVVPWEGVNNRAPMEQQPQDQEMTCFGGN